MQEGDQMGSLFCYISRQEMFGVLPGCLLSPGLAGVAYTQ